MGRHRSPRWPSARGSWVLRGVGASTALAAVAGVTTLAFGASGAFGHPTSGVLTAGDPAASPSPAASTSPSPRPSGPCAAGRIALTFDDGPRPGVTDRILDELVRLDVPATFFVEGRYVEAAPHLVARMARTPGMVVGDHSYDHPDLTTLSRAAVRSELLRTQRAVVAAGAPAPRLMRYPFGSHDRLTDRLVLRMGLRPVGWNLATHDPSQTTAEGIEAAAIERIDRAADTGHRHFLTVLMHDGQPNSRLDVRAVPPIVREARSHGFCFTAARPEDPAKLRRHDESGAATPEPTPTPSTGPSPSPTPTP